MRRLIVTVVAVGAAAASAADAGAVVQLASNARGDQVLLDDPLSQRTRALYAATRAPGTGFGPLTALTPAGAAYGGSVASVDDAGGALVLATGFVFDGQVPTPATAQLLA